ncbi:MAG: ilvN [Acidimicrobiales bacterium]|nr:ilvN [Acidimicrobiales bacterium]
MSAEPVDGAEPIGHHTLSVLVENKAGVLARVVNLFSRRGYNIFSLAVAPTTDVRFSRITVVVDVASAPLEQIVKQLDKLINVVSISEHDPRDSVERELLLATVCVDPSTRDDVLGIVGRVGGRVLEERSDRLTVSYEDDPTEVDAVEALLRPFGITELQRTGRVALPKLDREATVASGT